MRWLIGVLLVLNLVFGLWQLYFDRPAPQTPPPPDVGHLRLWSEPDGNDQSSAKPQAATPASQASVTAGSQAGPTPKPGTKPVALATPASAQGVSTQTTAPPAPQPKPAPKTQPVAPPEVCWQLPAADTQDVAQRMANQLPPVASLLRIVKVQVPQIDAYFVMIPPAKSRQQADATIERLRRKGIKQTWLLRHGPKRNAISLGVFSDKGNADSYVRQIRHKGFDAEVEPRQRMITRYAVQARAPKDLQATQLQQLLPGQPKAIACP